MRRGDSEAGFDGQPVQESFALRPACCARASSGASMECSQHHDEPLYPLTSLQIGDMQSYISKLYLHANHEKLVLFVDNGPWTAENRRSKSVELWQLMVTQSRTSPFANRSLRCSLVGRMNRESAEEPSANTVEGFTVEKSSSTRRLFQKEKSRLVKFFRDSFRHRLRSVVSMQELSHLLYGCVTFELEWKSVRGINYVNELQTDTCVALEMKLMVKRDFCDFNEALASYGIEPLGALSSSLDVTSPLRHSSSSQRVKNNHIDCVGGESSPCTPCSTEFSPDYSCLRQVQGYKDDCSSLHGDSDSDCELFDSVCHIDDAADLETGSCFCDVVTSTDAFTEGGLAMDVNCEFSDAVQCGCQCDGQPIWVQAGACTHEAVTGPHMCTSEGLSMDLRRVTSDSPHNSDLSDDVSSSCSLQDVGDDAPLVYRDTLLLFRFCDPILPLELKQIIMANQRLLKMLESGLPSWVIFLQSYPVVSKFYRPWMRPLAKTMYILVSIVTVIIGFYDLYKNVPVLKAMAARICGPLFEWIEAWEMVSRIKYLGTVLFLQNWEKAFRWLLLVFRTTRNLSAIIMKPMIEPLEELSELIWPVWSLIFESVWGLTSLVWMLVSSVFEFTNNLVQLIVWPFTVLLTATWTLVSWLLYPIICAVWGLIVLPLRLTMLLVDLIKAVVCSLYKAIQDIWVLVNSWTQLLSVAGPQAGKTAKSSASTWRLLWNDIFSQVFRAVRSIVNVLIAFFITCNRHRLSIYNHTTAFIFRLTYLVKSAHSRVSNGCHNVLDTSLLNQGVFEDEGGHKRSSRGSTVGLMSRKKRRIKGSLSGT